MTAGPWEYHIVAGPIVRNGDKAINMERFYKVEATCDGRTKYILVNEKRVERDGWNWFGPYLARLTPDKVPDEISA